MRVEAFKDDSDEVTPLEDFLPIDEMVEEVSEGGKKVRRKGIYLLPNLFTSAALFAGFFAIIAAINPPINTEVFFYESTSDRNSNSNNIPDLTNYRNNPTNIDITVVPDGIRFPIYFKILSTINNDCEGIGQFYLQINQVPTVNPYGDLILCDDGDDGAEAGAPTPTTCQESLKYL